VIVCLVGLANPVVKISTIALQSLVSMAAFAMTSIMDSFVIVPILAHINCVQYVTTVSRM
jgi:hypothetical protein